MKTSIPSLRIGNPANEQPSISLLLCQEFSYHSQNLLPKLGSLEMTHMSSIRERDPAHTRYVLEERCGSFIVGSIELAIVDECGNGNLMQAGYARPVAKGSGTMQR